MASRLSRLVGTRFQVLFHSPPGVLFTFPSRYSSAIGHQGVFRLSGWSRRIHTEFHGLGATWETRSGGAAFSCTGLSPSAATPSRGLPLTTALSHSPASRQTGANGPTTPLPQPLPGLTWKRFSLLRFRSPLLTESRLFSSPVGTEMFHFPTFPPHALCVQARVTPHDWCGVPPFGHPRINARLAAPRGLSQPPTSFIGSWCPGIHRVPLTTWPHSYNNPHTPASTARTHLHHGRCAARGRARCAEPANKRKMLASTVQFSTTNRPPPDQHPAEPHPRRTATAATHEGGWCGDPDGPDTRQPTTPTGTDAPRPHPGGSAPSGPNSVPTTGPRAPPRSPRPPKGPPYWERQRDCRPNWSAFHPRAPPHTRRRHPDTGTGPRHGRGSAPPPHGAAASAP